MNSNSNSSKGTPGFPPSPLEVDCNTESLQGLVHHCLSLCDTDVRRDLLGNIVIVGGGSLIDGVSNRLLYELNEILPSNMKVCMGCFVSLFATSNHNHFYFHPVMSCHVCNLHCITHHCTTIHYITLHHTTPQCTNSASLLHYGPDRLRSLQAHPQSGTTPHG